MQHHQPAYLHSPYEIEKMRTACGLAAELLNYLGAFIKPGVTTATLNGIAFTWAEERNIEHAPYQYTGHGDNPPFEYAICTSVNDVICHGYPDEEPLKEGDIVNVDVSPKVNGWIGDTSRTFLVGRCSELAERLVKVTEECMMRGIATVKPGSRIGDIGAAIAEHAQDHGFSVVREMVGHGVGRKFHTGPIVFHFGVKGTGQPLQPGMIFTVEPMINEGLPDINPIDAWLIKTKDGKLSAQFEHTVLVTETGHEILTVTKESELD